MPSQPTNRNFLTPIDFKFTLQNAPVTNFFVTAVNLPGLNLPIIEMPGVTKKHSIPGDNLTYNSLSVTFKVDEDMNNYFEILDWMVRLGAPETFEQYQGDYTSQLDTSKKAMSDASLIITTNKKNANIAINFKDAFPTSLSDLQFDVAAGDEATITCTAEFAYTVWTYQSL